MFPGQEHIENRGLNLLHRTVLKLNPLNLDTLLYSVPRSTVDQPDAEGCTALWWAATSADYTAISSLLDYGADVDIATYAGRTILNSAISSQNQDCIKLLLKHGCDSRRFSDPSLPLHSCSFFGADLEVFEMILDRGTDINSTTLYDKWTALMVATQEHHDQICEYLIVQGADVNRTNIDGESALHVAVCYNNHKMIRLLPQYHADHRVKTYIGETLLHYAAQFGDLGCLKILHLLNLEGVNPEDTLTGCATTQALKGLKGLTALEIAERRPNMSPEWLTMCQTLIRGIEFPSSKVSEAATGLDIAEDAEEEMEEFQDATEYQDL